MSREDTDLPPSLWLQPQDPPLAKSIGVNLLADRVVIARTSSIASQLIVTSVLLLVAVPVLWNWIQLGTWGGVGLLSIALAVAMYFVWMRPAKFDQSLPAVAILDERPAVTGDIRPRVPSECELRAGQIKQVEVARRVYSIDRSEEHFELSVQFNGWPDRIVIQRRSFVGLSRLLQLAEQLATRWRRELKIQAAVVERIRARPSVFGNIATALLLLMCLAGILGIGLPQFRMKSWPIADAQIIEFDESAPVMEEGGSLFATRKIRYRYQVSGRDYESRSWNPSRFNYQSRTSLENDSRGFAIGATVPCWYDPARPERSYIVNRGLTALPQVLLVVVLVTAIFIAWNQTMRRRLVHLLDELKCRNSN